MQRDFSHWTITTLITCKVALSFTQEICDALNIYEDIEKSIAINFFYYLYDQPIISSIMLEYISEDIIITPTDK